MNTSKYEQIDKRALVMALLALKVCPNCRNDLNPVAYLLDVWGCVECRETWYLPERKENETESV